MTNNTINLKYDGREVSRKGFSRYSLEYLNGLEIGRFGNPEAAIDYAFKHGWVVQDCTASTFKVLD